jgi:hypothetical protein
VKSRLALREPQLRCNLSTCPTRAARFDLPDCGISHPRSLATLLERFV